MPLESSWRASVPYPRPKEDVTHVTGSISGQSVSVQKQRRTRTRVQANERERSGPSNVPRVSAVVNSIPVPNSSVSMGLREFLSLRK
jgi:hypothetical protein